MKVMGIGLFGILGVYARYFGGLFIGKFWPGPFPGPTFIINLLGSFLIGIVFSLGTEKMVINSDLRLAITAGFLRKGRLTGSTSSGRSGTCLSRSLCKVSYVVSPPGWMPSPVPLFTTACLSPRIP